VSLTITHTHTEGTLIEGTERGDGTAEILKQFGWRWSRNLGSWYVPQTRLVSSPARAQRVVKATVTALQGNGFTVTVEADWSVPDDSLDARIVQQQGRVAALEAKLDRKVAAEATADARDLAAGNALPWGGEPIKIGHHSEGRHRRALEKAHTAAMKAYEAGQDTRHAEESLQTAQHHLARMQAEVGRVLLTRADILGATEVRDRRGWHKVRRINQKTVTTEEYYPWIEWGTPGHIAIEQVLEVRTVTS
jgi:hypothetical protein